VGYTAGAPADGIRHTRAGSFHVDPEGTLATPAGHLVLGEGGPIQVGQRPVAIQADGSVTDDEGTVLGRLRLEEFLDTDRLRREGASLLRAPADVVPVPVEAPSFATGSIEGSNVQTVQELARLVIVQRAFDASMRTLEAEDAASSRLLQEI
jgi:flagellar basal body rod protein FlgG